MSTQTRPALLYRELRLWGDIMMEIGSIVSIGIAVGIAGPSIILVANRLVGGVSGRRVV